MASSAHFSSTDTRLYDGFKRIEPWLFRVLTLLHLAPVVITKWFVTLDGPVHLYGARVVKGLVLHEPMFASFFRLNGYPDPYWSGQALGAALLLIFPAWLVEKLIWSSAIIGLAAAFRFFIATVAPERKWASLFVLPFLLHHGIWMGYQNFCLSIPLMFVAIALVQRMLNMNKQHSITLFVVFLALYFAHLSTFIVTIGVIAFSLFRQLITELPSDRKALPTTVRTVLLCSLLPVIFTGLYFVHVPAAEVKHTRLPLYVLVEMIWQGRVLNGFGSPSESFTCSLIAIVVLGATAITLALRFIYNTKRWEPSDRWMIITFFGTVAYFVLPDAMAGGFNTSPRILLFVMFFVCTWLVVACKREVVLISALLIIIPVDLYHLAIQTSGAKGLGLELDEYMMVSDDLPERSVVLPLNYGSNWIHSNFSNYLGVGEQPIIVLDNFIANTEFGPAQWKAGMAPYEDIGDHAVSNKPCVRTNDYHFNSAEQITAIVTWKRKNAEMDSCFTDLEKQLNAQFKEIGSSRFKDVIVHTRK